MMEAAQRGRHQSRWPVCMHANKHGAAALRTKHAVLDFVRLVLLPQLRYKRLVLLLGLCMRRVRRVMGVARRPRRTAAGGRRAS